MKNLTILLAFSSVFLSTTVYGQVGFGIRAGLNFETDKKITDITSEFSRILNQEKSKTGYNVGLYTNFQLDRFYLRPELWYTNSKFAARDTGYSINKFELPFSVGYEIIAPISVFIGPTLSYAFDEIKTTLSNPSDIKKNFTIGIHYGARINISGLGIEFRYDRGITENELRIFAPNNQDIAARVDARPAQWILGLSYQLNFSRRGR